MFEAEYTLLDDVVLEEFSANPSAVPVLKKHLDKVCWPAMCANQCPEAVDLLAQHLDKIDWSVLSANSCAVRLFKGNDHLLDWRKVNTNECALDLLGIYEWHGIWNSKSKHFDMEWFSQNPHPLVAKVLSSSPYMERYYHDSDDEEFYDDFENDRPTKWERIWRNFQKNPSEEALQLVQSHCAWEALADDLTSHPHYFTKYFNYETAKRELAVEGTDDYYVQYFPGILRNPSPEAMELVEMHFNAVPANMQLMTSEDWRDLARNPCGVVLVLKWWHMLDAEDLVSAWLGLLANPNASAMPWIEKHWDDLKQCPQSFAFRRALSSNPNAVHVFAKLDLAKMRAKCQPFAEDLMKFVLSPSWICKVCKTYQVAPLDYADLLNV